MKMYLAGVECCDVKWCFPFIRHGLTSYYQHRKVKQRALSFDHICNSIPDVMVDSGAHSFFSRSGNIESARVTIRPNSAHDESPDEYFANYVDWMARMYDRADWFVELDIQEIVGMDKVLSWRSEYVKMGVADKVLIVYHPDVELFEDFVRRADQWPSRYVGIEGPRRYKPKRPIISWIKTMYDLQIGVHGFACVKANVMSKQPFYSVDSTSWMAPATLGTIVLPEFVGHWSRPCTDQAKSKMAEALVNTPGLMRSVTRQERIRSVANRMGEVEDAWTQYWLDRGVDWSGIPIARRVHRNINPPPCTVEL